MPAKKHQNTSSCNNADEWLFKKLATAPRPLPAGRFPNILAEAEREGFDRESLLAVLDLWLNYGYCRIIDPITQDIALTEEGMRYFY